MKSGNWQFLLFHSEYFIFFFTEMFIELNYSPFFIRLFAKILMMSQILNMLWQNRTMLEWCKFMALDVLSLWIVLYGCKLLNLIGCCSNINGKIKKKSSFFIVVFILRQ